MYGQKIRLLRQLSESQMLRLLSGNALKVYLVLLVSAERIGWEESIDAQTIQRALGRKLSRREVLRIGAALERRGLAALRVFSPRRRSSGHDDAWCFRVLARGDRKGNDGGRKARASGSRRGR